MRLDTQRKKQGMIEASEERIIGMIQEALHPFRPALHGYRVILFGSRVTRRNRERSDYDLGILGEKSLPEDVFFSIEDALEQIPTLHQIDWVNLNQVNKKFLECALRNAKIVYE